ncbi:hypothetical protein ACLB2K_023087 [Fragaria x ananassa]
MAKLVPIEPIKYKIIWECYQSAFVPGRCIHDNVVTAFEIIHSIRNKQTGTHPYYVLKLDISKAYDRVEWIFLRNIMLKLGFSERWVELVMKCVESVSFSILWNGKAMGMINPSRGFRQGDPLSPYLFLLCSEGLTSLFQNVEREGSVHGAKVSERSPPISHLLFADDSMLFGRAEMQELTLLKQCLLLYERAAGQKVNFQKSAVAFGPGLLEEQKSSIATFLGVPVVPFHEKNLGLPTVAGRNKMEMFKRIHERLDQHLQGWQSRLLSKAGKTILIKAIAQAIPSYTMSVFKLSKGVCRTYQSKRHRLDQNRLSFGEVWCGGKSFYVLVLDGGLVINGTAIQIWEDKWLPSPWSFRVVTPRFMDSNTRVSTLMMSPGMWDVIFIQTHFLPVDADKILSILVCERSGSDVAIWHYTNDGYYTVKSGYWLAIELKQVGKSTSSSGEKDETNSNSVWSIIWGLSVLNKVKLFLWRACHAFLPCVERLFKRKVCSSDTCGRCGGANESVLHSLWACRIAQKVWKYSWLAGVVKLWKFQSFSDLLHRVAMEGTNKELELFGLVCWWIWKCRNDTIHGKEGLKPDILVQQCKEWQSELAQTQSTNKLSTGIVVKEIVSTPQVSNTSSSLLYFDGAVDKLNGRVGVGAVVLNPEHGLLGALSVPLPLSLNPKATEALALWYGIEYGKKLGLLNVDIRGDALNVLNGLNTRG